MALWRRHKGGLLDLYLCLFATMTIYIAYNNTRMCRSYVGDSSSLNFYYTRRLSLKICIAGENNASTKYSVYTDSRYAYNLIDGS